MDRDSILIHIFKNKGDVQSCSNYRGIKLISHSMKLWERVVERRLRSELTFCEQQCGFMPGKCTTGVLFALRVLMEKYREGQKELHCVFVDLEKAYERVPREEVWYLVYVLFQEHIRLRVRVQVSLLALLDKPTMAWLVSAMSNQERLECGSRFRMRNM